ncbi:MAG TPA: hypothetical protein VHT53_06430 [Candidatus Elarobacter sp.]|jgi:uncharacterized protein YuzE|nr:hypothetical protein [Candidatus Elarobacter sp.]
MLKPIQLRLDYDVGAGYLKYRNLADAEHVARNARISEDVIVDYTDADEVVGIELLAFDEETLDVARSFASRNGLLFPDTITARAATA